MDWNWVTPRIALGSAPRASDISRMQQQGITDVLDLRGEPNQGETGPQGDVYLGTGITYHYLPMLDRGGIEPVSVYQQGVGIMQSVLSDPTRKALVHCAAGEYRSPSVVYAYLRSVGFMPQDAWNLIRTARPVVQNQYVPSAEAAVPYLPSPPSMTTGQKVALLALVGGTIALGVWASRKGTVPVAFARRNPTPMDQPTVMALQSPVEPSSLAELRSNPTKPESIQRSRATFASARVLLE